jgi:CheY-like chemotaxis protein
MGYLPMVQIHFAGKGGSFKPKGYYFEDDPMISEIWGQILEADFPDHQIHLFDEVDISNSELLHSLRNPGPFDFVISDFRMPCNNAKTGETTSMFGGKFLMEHLLQEMPSKRSIPVIWITGFADEAYDYFRAVAKEATTVVVVPLGADNAFIDPNHRMAFVSKPVKPTDIYSELTKLISGSSLGSAHP